MKNFFAILGGMGTLATESFVHLLNERTPANCDQDYLNYLVVNHATVPDRTAYIKNNQLANPKDDLIEDITSITPLNPEFFVVTCNTAHFFFDELQAATHLPVLHMPRIAINTLAEKFPVEQHPRILFLGTEGSIIAEVYKREIEGKGYEYIQPDSDYQDEVNRLIYDDIKEKGYLNFDRYLGILRNLKAETNYSVAILGCTELSYIEANYPGNHGFKVIDAQSELVNHVIGKMKGE